MQSASAGIRRSADAMVRHLGAAQVTLEIPAPPVAGDDGEQLGLSTPDFQARVLAPVAVRTTQHAVKILVAAEVLEELLDVHGFGLIAAVVGTVYAVVIGDTRYRLTGVECVCASGDACLYRLLLQPAGTEVL